MLEAVVESAVELAAEAHDIEVVTVALERP